MFLLFTVVGVLAGALHVVLPGPHHLRASAFAVALWGSWLGGYCAAAFVQGTFVSMGWVTLVGSVIGAVAHLVILELVLHRFLRSERYADQVSS